MNLPGLQPDPYISVVVAEYREKPELLQGLVAQTGDGGYSLLTINCYPKINEVPVKASRRESVPEYLNVISTKKLQWKIYVSQPGKKKVDVSYSYQGNPRGNLSVKCANDKLEHELAPTGKTVGEPNSNWVIDNYKSHRLGEIDFPAQGIYEIELEIAPGKEEELKFQWIWVQ